MHYWRFVVTFPFQNCKPGISLNYLHLQTTLEIGRMLKGVAGCSELVLMNGCHGYLCFLL